MDLLRTYAQEKMTGEVAYSPDIVVQLKQDLQRAEFRAEKIKKLLGLIERNPDFHEMINLSREL